MPAQKSTGRRGGARRPESNVESAPGYGSASHAELQPPVPADLRNTPRWIRWSLATGPNGRPTKRPDCSTLDPTAWRSWADVADVPRSTTEGIGFVLTNGVTRDEDGARLVALDLDSCVDANGIMADWANDVLQRAGATYVELSPSGFGLRAWLWVKYLPRLARTRAPINDLGTIEGKNPEVQLFGANGAACYVTVTGDALPGSSPVTPTVENIGAMLVHLGLDREPADERNNGALPVGEGPVPTVAEIEAAVRAMPHGPELVDGKWHGVVGEDASASEAYAKLVAMTLRAARGHAEAVVDFLLHRTTWGDGDVADSRDPLRYARDSWVRKDVARIAAAMPVPRADVFPLVDPSPAPESRLGPDSRSALRLWRDVATDRPVRWIVDGLVPEQGFAVLGGEPNAGKSLIALDAALRCAHGMPFLERVTAPVSTLYLVAEGFNGLAARLRAWIAAHPDAEPVDGCYVALHDGAIDLTAREALARLDALLQECAARHGSAPGILVVDTLAMSLPGCDENDSGPVGAALGILHAIRRKYGCTILALHHVRKQGQGQNRESPSMAMLRGSSALAGAADVVLIARQDGLLRELATVKARDAECGEPLGYTVHGVATGMVLPNGTPEFGPVVLPAPESTSALLDADGREAALVRRDIEALTAAVESTRGVPLSRDGLIRAAKIQLARGREALRLALAGGTIVETASGRRTIFTVPSSTSRSDVPLKGGDVGTSADADVRDVGGRRRTSGRRAPKKARPDAQ